MKKYFFTIIFLLIISFQLVAQSVMISAGGSGNVELPNLTSTQINNIANPKTGMMVFDKTYNVVRVFDGSSWACMNCPNQPYSNIKKVQVKTFDYNPTNCGYTGLKDFASIDDGLGDVKTYYENGQPNGFLLDNQEVIVFDEYLTNELLNLNSQELLNLVQQSNWASTYTYVQNCDIAVRSDHQNLIYHVREAGKVERQEGLILGKKAYRFRNRIFLEKYGSSAGLLNNLITNNTTFNLLTATGITNIEQYHIISSSPFFVVTNGILSFYRPTNKPVHNFGVIYFLPKTNNLQLMRIRVYTNRPSPTDINTYFNQDGSVKNLSNYLNSYFLGQVLNTQNVPFVLHIPSGTNNLKVADDGRVPPPTAGTENTL